MHNVAVKVTLGLQGRLTTEWRISPSVTPVVSAAQTGGDDATSPHVEEIPLRPRLPLHLHRPHEPAHTPGPGLVAVNLRNEIFLQEVLVVNGVVGEVSVVNPG